MATTDNVWVKADRIVTTQLGVLEREVVLPRLVWLNPGEINFVGAKDDTVSIRIPAYMNARTRTMRSGTAITVDDMAETKVDVTLDTQVYKAIGVTLEELTLDVVNFEQQIAVPATVAVARDLEDALATEMTGATYENEIALDADDPWLGIVDAKLLLDQANVPLSQRFLAIGSNVEGALLKSDRLSLVQNSGSDSALRQASLGTLASFTAVSVPGLDPDVAIAAHQTAFVMTIKAPSVPQGANGGGSRSFAGFAMTSVFDYDFLNQKDRFSVSTFVGTGVTQDHGSFDSDGRFVPSEDPDTEGGSDLVVARAVKLTLGS